MWAAGFATRLFVTEHTVEKQVKNIFANLRLTHSPQDHWRVLAVPAYLQASYPPTRRADTRVWFGGWRQATTGAQLARHRRRAADRLSGPVRIRRRNSPVQGAIIGLTSS